MTAGQDVKVWVVNDHLETYEDMLELKVVSFSGEELFRTTVEVTIPGNASKKVVRFTEEELLGGFSANEAVICLSSLNEKAKRNVYYFRDHKDLVLPESPLVVGMN